MSSESIAAPAGIPSPKRGGTHPIYGTFLGGAKLDDSYHSVITKGTSLFRFSTQRRHEKTLARIEDNLRAARDSITTIKFNGRLEAPEGNLTEIGKERFVQLLRRSVIEHGQQTFYHIRDMDGKVVDLFDNSHRFKLQTVIDEHVRRSEEEGAEYELYDQFERDEVELSRMVVDSLLTESFLEKLVVRYGHREDFESLPGSCVFMMALEACNASVAHDVEGARQKLEVMSLDSYPGENVTDFAADAQKLLKIMQGDYAMPIHTGSNILKKLTRTSSEFFNRKIFTLLDSVKTMEQDYKLADPRTLMSDPLYSKLGPLGLIANLQAAHGALLTEHDWPALSATLPQSNNSSVSSVSSSNTPSSTTSRSSGTSRMRCFRCRGNHHVRDCPEPAPSAGTNSDGTPRASDRPLADWKYIRPADLTAPYVDNRGRSWKFCTHCRCRATQRMGHYQLSHFDNEHRGPDPGPPAPTAATPASSNPSVLPTAPSGNHTQVLNPSVIPPGPPEITLPPSFPADDDPDAIEFQGMWCVPVVGHDAAAVTITAISLVREENVIAVPSTSISTSDTAPLLWFDCEVITADFDNDLLFFDAVSDSDLFFDAVSPSVDHSLLSVHPALIPVRSWFLQCCFLLFFWLTALFWDTLTYFVSAPQMPKPLRRIRRSSRTVTLRGFPAGWVIMSAVMIYASSYQGFPPSFPALTIAQMSTYVVQESISTLTRIRALDDMVLLQSDTLWQFHQLKGRHFLNSMSTSSFGSLVITPRFVQSQHVSPLELDQFFDAVNETPEPYTGDRFFDAETWTNDPSSPDLFPFQDICSERVLVDCRHEVPTETACPSTPSTQAQVYLTSLGMHSNTLLQFGTVRHPVIFDTGASLGITFDRNDFDGPLTKPEGELRLGGMAQGLQIEGIGSVTYTFRNGNQAEVQIRSNCYYVPKAKVRLLSPQRLFNHKRSVGGKFEGNESTFKLVFDNGPTLTIEYDEHNHLPIGYALVGDSVTRTVDPQANVLLLDDTNQNLTAGQKLLLQWHARFGHLNFRRVQTILRGFPFSVVKYASASKCDTATMKCAICQYAKAHRRATHGSQTAVNSERDGSLTAENLNPGKRVSVDHFESRLLGRTFDSFGKASSDQYKGGCIFVDHGSGYLHVEHQLGFSAIETIRAKQNFEKMALDHGVVIQSFLTDSGAFKANAFVDHIRNSGQRIQYCGTNAHHQNGVAERSIRTVSNMSRALILHAAAHWPNGIDSSLWPMAVKHSVYIYNNTPNQNGVCPSDLFTGEMVPRHRLKDFHTWGCPVFILDPKLQSGQKLPRWQPRSRQGIFMGLSMIHSSEVPLVLNTTTGSITPQFHVVFDDEFSTVASLEREHDPPSFWNDLCLENAVYIPVEANAGNTPHQLIDDWLTPEERAVKQREIVRLEEIRSRLNTTMHRPTEGLTTSQPPTTTTKLVSESISRPFSDQVEIPVPTETPIPTLPVNISSAPPTPVTASNAPSTVGQEILSPSARRSERSNKGQYTSTRYFDEVFLTPLADVKDCDDTTKNLAYLAGLHTCYDTGLENISDPRVYAAKQRKGDPDSPTFHQAMNGEHAEDYIQAMKLEVNTLVQQRTWTSIPRTTSMNVLKGTWVFKLKRLPDGTPLKFKARFCARGDLQQEGVDYFETYAPVVQWSTIRLLLSTVLTEGWATRQVDYTNAFAQAEIKEEVYLEFPRMFGPKSGNNVVLKLLKSLYGLKQAPRTFFEKLRAGLLERGYSQSIVDPCLFLKRGIMCVVYVDDTIFAGADAAVLEAEIAALGVSDATQRHQFQLRNEGEVGAFLGIQIKQTGPHEFYLSQPGLIDKVLTVSGMTDSNGVDTPTSTRGGALGADLDGDPFLEEWNYRTVIGMLMFISANTRPDIAFAVHQAARFSHSPRASHAHAVKRILRYLQRTKDKGFRLCPNTTHQVDCYVDADFAGNFAAENPGHPDSVKSRTGYIILYRGSPLLWVSKMQSLIALSTMEAEYVALSQAMRDLIPIRELLKEVMATVFDVKDIIHYRTHSKAFQDVTTPGSSIPPSTVYEDNTACLKFAQTGQLSPRTKHIGVPYHWFRSKVESLDISIVAVSTTDQLADTFTKGLSLVPFQAARRILMGW